MGDKIIPKNCYEIFRGACERIYDLNDTLLDIAKSCDTDIPDIYGDNAESIRECAHDLRRDIILILEYSGINSD